MRHIAALLRRGKNTVRPALDRLTAAGLVREERRGTWRVFNPAWPGRCGPNVDATITDRTRLATSDGPTPRRQEVS